MKIFRTLVIPLMLICVMFFTSMTTACPSKSTIQKAINASDQIDSLTLTAVSATESAFAENLLTLEQKNSITPKLDLLAKGSAAFKNAALTLKAEYKNGETPPSKLATLNALFSDAVVVPFLDVLKDLKLIKSATKIIAALGIIRVAVLSISQALGKGEQVSMEINQRYSEAQMSPYS